jgi:hypothetical protein
MDVRIARCSATDIDDTLGFIDEHWKRGHVLASSRLLLDWQHREPDGYSFVIARRSVDDAIVGLLGFIATERYDPALAPDNVIWLTMWKVRDDARVAGLGIQLLTYLERAVPHRAIGAIFPSQTTSPIYRALGFRVGEMAHYVARRNHRARTPSTEPALIARRLVADADFESLAYPDRHARIPRKTVEYFRRRYARHPMYRYVVTAVLDDRALCGLVASRTVEHDGARAVRVVDCLGSDRTVARMGPIVGSLIDEAAAEYADMYNAGIDESALTAAGFHRVDPDGTEIVPDYFEPFEPRNVRLWFALKGAADPVLFKGDSDRDRPNHVPAGQ